MKKKAAIILGVIATISLVLFLIMKGQKAAPLLVVSTIPKANESFVDNKKEITIELNRPISLEDGENLKIKISPEIDLSPVYIENKIRAGHTAIFEYGITYAVSVLFYDKEIYNFQFSANPFTPEQLEKEGKLQAEGDAAYNEATKKFIQDNPWYTKLPIETKDFRIVYDYSRNKFRIRFLREVTDEATKASLIENALTLLDKAGAKKPIEYYTLQPTEPF